MSQIHHIVFDVGLVLLHWNADLIYRDLIPDPHERADFLASVCTAEWNIEQDRGRSWAEGEQMLIDQYPDKADLIRAFRRDWIKSVPRAYEDIVEIYQGLIGSGRDVTLLTNFNQHTFAEAKGHYGFLNLARAETVSGEVQLIKPDAEIYEHHTQAHGLSAKNTLFIDDSPHNIAAARAHGWQGFQFAGAEGAGRLKAGLAEVGIEL